MVDCLEGLWMNYYKDEQASGGEVFLSWCGARVGMDLSLLWLWLSPIYSGLGPLPKYEREGIPQRRDLKGDK